MCAKPVENILQRQDQSWLDQSIFLPPDTWSEKLIYDNCIYVLRFDFYLDAKMLPCIEEQGWPCKF